MYGQPASGPYTSTRSVTATILFFCYLAVVPVALYLLTRGEFGTYFLTTGSPEVGIWLFALHTYASLRLAMVCTERQTPLLRFPFYAFVYVWIANVPAIQFSMNELPWGIKLGDGDYLYSLMVITTGILAYEIGGSSIGPARDRTAQRQLSPLFSPTRVQILALACCGVVVAMALQIGLDSLITSRNDAAEAIGAGNQITLLLRGAFLKAPIVVCMFAMLCIVLTGAYRRIPLFGPLFILVTACFVLANFPTAISRHWLGAIVLGILAIAAISHARNYYTALGLPIVAAFLLIYPMMAVFRNAFSVERLGAWNSIQSYLSGDFDVFQMVSIITYFADTRGIEWGYQFLGPLFFWVPRSLWPDKPIGTGAFVAEALGMRFNNVSAPLWAEAYINFGLAGVSILFGAYGRLARRWENMLSASSPQLQMIVIASFLSGFQVFMLRGDLLSSTAYLLPVLLVAFIGLGVAREPRTK